MMNQKERTAIAATLDNKALMSTATSVCGYDIGDPFNDNLDSVKLREKFGLTIEYHTVTKTAWAFNDTVQACWHGAYVSPEIAGRRATVIAVAAMWVPVRKSPLKVA